MSKKQHISTEMKANIADALAGGLSYAMIADRYDVSYSTIQRVKSAVINGANFIAKKEVPEVHDTPTEQKKSPETVSTPIEPASEDITNSGNPADTNIIPEVPENVKWDDYSPYNPAVDDAVLERIERLHTKIEELNHDIVCYEKEISAMMQYHEKCMEVENERNNENQ